MVSATRELMLQAAMDTLREEGFAGASARAIARRGDLNQALVFYHFGSVKNLLLAALDETSARRMEAYRAAAAAADSIEDLVTVALETYRVDLASGHITILSEMIAGSIADPDLAAQVLTRMEPWIDIAAESIGRALKGSPIEGLLSEREIAFAVVAFYLGVDLLTHLDPERPEPEVLFKAAASFVPLLTAPSGHR